MEDPRSFLAPIVHRDGCFAWPQAMTTETLNYFNKASACVMVIDATDQKTVSHAQRHLAQLLDNANSALSACRVLLVLANKQVFPHWLAQGVTYSFVR